MSRIVTFLMVLAWMALSAMPALAMHLPMVMAATSGAQVMAHDNQQNMPDRHAAHHASSERGTAALVENGCRSAMMQTSSTRTSHDNGHNGTHTTGKACMMAACAGCVTLPAQDVAIAWLVLPPDAPTQGLIAALTGHPTRPAERPPRL